MISSISMADFLKLKPEGQIIDIRSVQSYNNNHIPNAKNIPMEKILSEPHKYLNKFEVYYIYCQRGIRSVKVCKYLKQLGYKVVNIEGGYESWILER